MTGRAERWLSLLADDCENARLLVSRGRHAFDSDPALPLAFEALANRIGDISKRLMNDDPARFSEPLWSLAARNRDFVVHHYDVVDRNRLWLTVVNDFPSVAALVAEKLAHKSPDD
ncbi:MULTISPECIES: DUF86 domain-containing protein [unclassified Rathayibacter]|uniref:HepT-like ribonuclease domain-containing protein n=1 Tax=unclassified Rathayibacter TaxID=2609250 RepID=UPI00188B8406|nr:MULTISPECIES: HepT-like ribonuclease domain-containing protein [unclassified Rathayibacter]MBF4462926.1 hypothetical protein [Rathayibacter sp. VKM Ac-2879]MBF4504340.1 hypothetical protein [Rathayibacter sp. VKM Ac-2878]